MKVGLLVFIIMIPVGIVQECSAQAYKLAFTNSGKLNTDIQEVNDSIITTTDGDFHTKNIESITIADKEHMFPDLIDVLTGYGIPIIDPQGIVINQQSPVFVSTKESDDIRLIIDQIDKFNDTRATGKGMQVTGLVIAIVGSSVADNDTNSNRTIAYAGAGLSVIGFIIDMTAGRHLREIKKKYRP